MNLQGNAGWDSENLNMTDKHLHRIILGTIFMVLQKVCCCLSFFVYPYMIGVVDLGRGRGLDPLPSWVAYSYALRRDAGMCDVQMKYDCLVEQFTRRDLKCTTFPLSTREQATATVIPRALLITSEIDFSLLQGQIALVRKNAYVALGRHLFSTEVCSP